MKHYIFIIVLTIAIICAEEVKINIYPTASYNQRIDITNKNTNTPALPMATPIVSNPTSTTSLTTNQPAYPNVALLTDNPIVNYTLLKKCCFSVALATAASYLTSLGYLISQSRNLKQDSHWYNWKQEVPLAALRELSQEQIVQALRESLHKKYNQAAKDIFIIAAILQKEEQELRWIISCCSLIQQFRISFLFFNQDCVEELAKQKLERLLFIKEILAKHITFIMESPSITNEGTL